VKRRGFNEPTRYLVHDDEEFIAHLERVARAEDDLPSDEDAESAPRN